jgi:RNA-directed DNA polymerase
MRTSRFLSKELKPKKLISWAFSLYWSLDVPRAIMNIIRLLSQNLKKSESEVEEFLSEAPNKYKVYTIPKRTHGHRIIAQPSKDLKEYQRFFIKQLESELPLHHSAMAYRKGISIKDNANIHKNQQYLLKMDLENFFNSINPALFWRTWEAIKVDVPNDKEKRIYELLLFWCPSKKNNGKLILSIGAPSSPIISNFCMRPFDELITTHCDSLDIFYSRYADDLTFSTNKKDILLNIPKVVQKNLFNCFGSRLTINHGKTAFSSKAHNRHVTGITITNEGKLSLGRKRKRYIKHLVNEFKYNKLDQSSIESLRGLLTFANHIEPKFLISLKAKYSDELIFKILEVNHD